MNRRRPLRTAAAAAPLLPGLSSRTLAPRRAVAASRPLSRVRPGGPAWPSEASWDRLSREVGGRLVRCSRRSPHAWRRRRAPLCAGPQGTEEPLLPRRRGRADAVARLGRCLDVQTERLCRGRPTTEDVVAAVNFARENNLRLVVKGGGHSYQGTSNAADLVADLDAGMNAVTLHDAFVGAGCATRDRPRPAVTIEAGAIWGGSTTPLQPGRAAMSRAADA